MPLSSAVVSQSAVVGQRSTAGPADAPERGTVGAAQPAGSATERPGQGNPEAQSRFRNQAVEPVLLSREVVTTQSRSDEEQLPFRAQQALRAFADNGPTAGQQLGIELAGIDTYV